MAVDLAELGKRIRTKREALGITIPELARRVEIERQTLGYIEKGTHDTSAATLALIAVALDASADELLDLPNLRPQVVREMARKYVLRVVERERVAASLDRTAKQMTNLSRRLRGLSK